MWTIDYTSNDREFRVSYDNEEIHTDSPALELFILKDIDNPPTLYATPVGPAEVFDLRVSYLAYYLVANILVEKLGIKDWTVQGDYLWPMDPDHQPIGSRTVFSSYVDYLKASRQGELDARTINGSLNNVHSGEVLESIFQEDENIEPSVIETEFSNDCHNPAGSGGGQFCGNDEGIHVHAPDKANPTGKGQTGTTLVKWGYRNIQRLEKELTEQGIDDMNPIYGVINHVGTHTLVYRDPQGKILGAYTIDIDKKEGVELLDFRVLGASQRQGVGTKLMQAAAKIAVDQTAYKTMLHVGSVGSAIPFYQKHGAEYQLEPGNGFSNRGVVDQKETKSLSEGHPATDKRTPDPYEQTIPHDTFGNVLGYNHVGWKDFTDPETNKPVMAPEEHPPYRPITDETGKLLPWVEADTKRRDASDYRRYIWTNDQPTIKSQWKKPEHSPLEMIPVDTTLSNTEEELRASGNPCHDAEGKFCETAGVKTLDGKEYYNSLPQEDKDLLDTFVRDSSPFNGVYTRKATQDSLAIYWRNKAAGIDRLMQDAPVFSPTKVYRGIQLKGFSANEATQYVKDNYKKEAVVQLAKGGFQSTSLDSSVAADFSLFGPYRDGSKSPGIVFEITATKGLPLSGSKLTQSHDFAQKEILLDRKTKFKVKGTREDTFTTPEGVKAKRTVVEVEQI